jgi:hypothetical protein
MTSEQREALRAAFDAREELTRKCRPPKKLGVPQSNSCMSSAFRGLRADHRITFYSHGQCSAQMKEVAEHYESRGHSINFAKLEAVAKDSAMRRRATHLGDSL